MPSITAVNLAHLHLLLNHVPTVGSVVALGLLLLALVRRNEHLEHAGLEVLFVIAVLTLPVYMSGVAAHQKLRTRPDVSDNAMRVHQDAALAGFTVTEFAGFVAWIALWQSRRHGRAARGLVPAVTLLSIVALEQPFAGMTRKRSAPTLFASNSQWRCSENPCGTLTVVHNL